MSKPKNLHAQALGRLARGKTSEAKKAASRANGKKGGYPKGRPRKPRTEAQRKQDWLRYGIGGSVQIHNLPSGAEFNAAMVEYYKTKEGNSNE